MYLGIFYKNPEKTAHKPNWGFLKIEKSANVDPAIWMAENSRYLIGSTKHNPTEKFGARGNLRHGFSVWYVLTLKTDEPITMLFLLESVFY